jgi:hypothetical protein
LVAPYSAKNMLFTHVAPRTKSKGPPIGGPSAQKILEQRSSKIPIGASKYFSYTVSTTYRSLQKKSYRPFGLSLSSDSTRLVKSYEDTKS